MSRRRIIGAFAVLMVAGSAHGQTTYDFASGVKGVDVIAYAGIIDSGAPAAASEPAAQMGAPGYAAVETEDAAVIQTDGVSNGDYQAHRFEFKLAEAPEDVGAIQIKWVGRAVNENNGRTDGATIWAWRVAGAGSGAWQTVAVGPDSEAVGTVVGSITADAADFVDGNGVVNILVASSDRKTGTPKQVYLQTDYISLTTGAGSTPQLLGHWTLDDGSGGTARDFSGAGRDGDLKSMNPVDSWVAGRLAGALAFDGFNDRVEVAHDPGLALDGGGTVAFWVLPTTIEGAQGLVTKDSADLDSGGQFGVVMEDDRIVARLESSTALYEVRSQPVLRADSWHHVAFTFGPSGMTLYVNGVAVDTDPYAGGGTNDQPLVFGGDTSQAGDGSSAGWTDPLTGALDDIRLYNYGLSADDVTELWEMGAPPHLVRWQEVAPD